jgi:hypothetical protein
MKNILFIVICILTSLAGFAQKPEKIYGKNQVLKTNEYYLQQMDLWKKETEKDPKNADAWYNYYRSSRNAYIVGEEGDKKESKGLSRFGRLKNIVLEMEKNVPGSYEYNFVKWLNGNNDNTLFPYLQKAYELDSLQPEAIFSLVYYHEINGDRTQRDKYIKEYYNVGNYSPGLLNYAYNMLVGLDKNAIIFTEGDKDMDGTFILQGAKDFRKDVSLLNMNLLLIKEYRERVFKELEIPPLDIDPFSSDESFDKYRKVIIEHVSKNKKGRPLYVSMTVREPYLETLNDNLHIIGLVYLYTREKVNDFILLKRNYEELYMLDYLRKYLPHDISEGNVKQFNLNYIPSLAALCAFYAEDEQKREHFRHIARKIGEDAGDLSSFEKYFQMH